MITMGQDPVEKEALTTYQTQKGLKGTQKPMVTLILRSQVSTKTVTKSKAIGTNLSDDLEEGNDDSDESNVDRGKYSESDLDD